MTMQSKTAQSKTAQSKTAPLKTNTEVLIVGAGPTGLTMACELLRRNIHCRLIDRANMPSQTSKALAVHSRTLEVFEDMGISKALLSQGVQVKGATVCADRQQLLELDFQRLNAPYSFILSVPQHETEHQLTQLLYQLGGTVERSKELVDLHEAGDRVTAVVKVHNPVYHADEVEDEVEEIDAAWVVGCDGASSQVRKTLGSEFSGMTYEEGFLLADVDLDWDLEPDRMQVWLHEDGPLAAIPLPNPQQWRLIANVGTEEGTNENEHPSEPTLEQLQYLLRERKGDDKTIVSNPAWCSGFKIHRRIVNHYRKGRVFLAGDAAHIHSPVGGQGMNIGIQDAYNLAWKLALVIQNDAPISLLDTYEAERRPVAQAILAATHTPTQLLVTQNPVLRFIRDRLVFQLINLEFIQPFILQGLAELNIHYSNSPLSQEYYSSPLNTKLLPDQTSETPSFKDRFDFQLAPKAGDRAPQGTGYRYPSHTPTTLFQEFKGTHWTLLLFDGFAQTESGYVHMSEIARDIETRFGDRVRSILILTRSDKQALLKWEGAILLDPDHALHQLYGAAAESLYLIRPDGYIGFRSQPPAKAPLLEYLSKFLRHQINV